MQTQVHGGRANDGQPSIRVQTQSTGGITGKSLPTANCHTFAASSESASRVPNLPDLSSSSTSNSGPSHPNPSGSLTYFRIQPSDWSLQTIPSIRSHQDTFGTSHRQNLFAGTHGAYMPIHPMVAQIELLQCENLGLRKQVKLLEAQLEAYQ
jgi:hypothetical protein